ncbi:MAG TPA: hypothetical protein VFJ82_07125, partial [Longimicrobium sp.]|nr:hypothetical protein [Longimicrobium sp.]
EGLAPLRRAAWRGTIELVALPDAPAADSGGRGPAADARRAVILAPEGRRLEYPVAALRATGWEVEILPRDQPLRGAPRLLVIGGSMTILRDSPEFAAVRAGATILFDGRVGARIQGEPMWDGFLAADSIAGTLRFADGPRLAGAAGRAVRPVPGKATVLAAWDDGEPAAVAWHEGRGCVVYLATQVDAGEMVLDPAYPRVLDRLAHGCSSPDGHGGDDAPLDAGARAVLAGAGARTVAAGAARAGGGVALGRWMMAAALLVALAETFLAYGRKKPA